MDFIYKEFTKKDIERYIDSSPMIVFSDSKNLIGQMKDEIVYLCKIGERDGWGCSYETLVEIREKNEDSKEIYIDTPQAINKYKKFQLYNKYDEYLGDIDNELTLCSVLSQVKNGQGYYLLLSTNLNEKYNIENGRIKKFPYFNEYSEILSEIMGF